MAERPAVPESDVSRNPEVTENEDDCAISHEDSNAGNGAVESSLCVPDISDDGGNNDVDHDNDDACCNDKDDAGGFLNQVDLSDRYEIEEDRQTGPRLENMPELVLMKIFEYLTIREKLLTESVSKWWRSYVDQSLRMETVFCPRLIHERATRGGLLHHSNNRHWNSLFRRMRDQVTGESNLVTIDLTCEGGSNHVDMTFPLEASEEGKFPRLKTAVMPNCNAFPPCLLRSDLLVNISLGRIDFSDLSFFVRLPKLKNLKLRRVTQRNLDLYGMGEELGGVSYSLESLTINLLSGAGMRSLVNAFPNLRELHLEGRLDFLLRSLAHCRKLRVLRFDFPSRLHSTDSISITMFKAIDFPSLRDLRLPCLDLQNVYDDEFDMPYLERLQFCGCERHEETDVVRFAVRALQKSVALRHLHLTKFWIWRWKNDFFSPEMRAVLSDGRNLELTFGRECSLGYRVYAHCSTIIRDLEALKVEFQLNGLSFKLNSRLPCYCDRILHNV